MLSQTLFSYAPFLGLLLAVVIGIMLRATHKPAH
jgi:hypothetical protein